MTDNNPNSSNQPAETSSPSSTVSPSTSSQPPVQVDRAELLDRARLFLRSPLNRYEDVVYQRRFLTDKGLTEEEINSLLRELPVQAPAIPPRTYPQPPPSNLPHLLAGIFRVFTWLIGGSAALLVVYYRFLLPRLTRSALARRSIKSHHQDLLTKLTTSLHGLKETQKDAFTVLPRAQPAEEPTPYRECQTLDDVLAASDGKHDVPETSLLRCALSDLAVQGKEPGTDELYGELFSKVPWLEAEPVYQESLWKTLNENPLFHNSTESSVDAPRWSHAPPIIPPLPTLLLSLDNLGASLPPLATRPVNRFQHALQAMIDFTGYLTTQTYSMSSAGLRVSGTTSGGLGVEEEEVRREIRALKGLVLNRRSFMPPRVSSSPNVATS